MARTRIQPRGFTLIELVVYLGLSSIVVVASTGYVAAATRVRVHTVQQQALQDDARSIIGNLSYTLRNAYRIDIVEAGARADVYAVDPDAPGHPIVTSYQLRDGVLRQGKSIDTPPAEMILLNGSEVTVSAGPVPFAVVSSSLELRLSLAKGGVTVPVETTISYRQH